MFYAEPHKTQIDHESRAQHPKLLHIRVYENAKDWSHKHGIKFPCTPGGSLGIEKLQRKDTGMGFRRVHSRYSESADLPC